MNALKKSVYFPLLIIVFTTVTPAFAEVIDFESDSTFYTNGDYIVFSGTADEESSGLVTIVIRDSNDEFVLLTQAFIQSNHTFERKIDTIERFEDHGIHTATVFIDDLTKGKTVSFDFSQDGTLPIPSITSTILQLSDEELQSEIDLIIESYLEEEIYESGKIADFVDPEKDSQYYLNRYYNESEYKSWFDRNYPELTIEEAVGLTVSNDFKKLEKNFQGVITNDVLPGAQAIQQDSNIINEKNTEKNETALLGLALGGLAILFGAVYGIKRKVDSNSKNISKNRESVRKKVFGAILNNNPEEVIKNRLAHGEITINEFNDLRKALRKK